MAEAPEIRLLGEVEVLHGGRVFPLPASKKTRALLGYLAVTGRSHTREQLCNLLWEGPDDPRAALRWSLAKLRSVLGPAALVADREHVALGEVQTDLDRVRSAIKDGIDAVAHDGLVAAAERFRGELLEGLALPDCYRYHEWFTAERESARALRVKLVTALIDRAPNSEQALRWAREHVALDPVSEQAHLCVVRLLGELGRKREAIAQFETCRRILAQETGAKPSAALLEARMQIASASNSDVPAPAARHAPDEPPPPSSIRPESSSVPLIGRSAELAAVHSLLERTSRGDAARVLVLLGEPGIGKSRMLAEVAARARSMGGKVLSGRAFEAEMVRPYGPFIDALKGVPGDLVPDELRSELASLVPALGGSGRPQDRATMFDAVARLMVHLAGKSAPVVLVLDDVHWLDEASAGLLHYVARALDRARVLIACGARSGELSDNAAALRLVRGLSRERRSETLELGPLESAATIALCRAAASEVDSERVVRDSGGNPLLALELTRALARDAGTVWESVGGLIGERLARLEGPALDLVSWAAALGRSFDLGTLERVTGTSPVDLVNVVADLERHGIVRASADGSGFDFVHDLVRDGAYRRLSEPARRVVHRRIARTIDEMARGNPALAGEVAHHADLGGDSPLAVRAALVAAQRCLRMFAGAEAARLADLGLARVATLPRDERLVAQVALLEVLVYAGAPARRMKRIDVELSRIVSEAEDAGQPIVASKGLHALSVLQFDEGDLAGAHESTIRAAGATQGADSLARARQLGESARCLATLERDVDRAQLMMDEARTIETESNAELLEVRWGAATLDAFVGENDRAAASLERALVLSRGVEDRWAEYECLRQLVQLDIEVGNRTERCAELLSVASKMSEGSELPAARALQALEGFIRDEPGAEDSLERALEGLRSVDAKGMSAYVLVVAAEHDFESGRSEAAGRRAGEALALATAVNRRSQMALARAVLGRVASACRDHRAAKRHLDAIRPDLDDPLMLSARARRAADDLKTAIEWLQN